MDQVGPVTQRKFRRTKEHLLTLARRGRYLPRYICGWTTLDSYGTVVLYYYTVVWYYSLQSCGQRAGPVVYVTALFIHIVTDGYCTPPH